MNRALVSHPESLESLKMGMEGDHILQRGGGGEMLAYSKITHSVFILTLKALTILKVDLQVHLSGDAKVMHKNIHTPPPSQK